MAWYWIALIIVGSAGLGAFFVFAWFAWAFRGGLWG